MIKRIVSKCASLKCGLTAKLNGMLMIKINYSQFTSMKDEREQ